MKSIGSEDSSLFIGLADDNGEVFDGRKPVRDRDFQVIRRTYAYDKTKPLNVKPEGTVESFYPGVTRDAYSFDTAYEGRMLAYVFRPSGPIPTNAQIMVGYFGGDGYRLDEFGTSNASHIRGMVGTGRILVAPILCGMHERRHEIYTSLSERLRKQVQDVSRCVDFLRKSPDFAGGRLIFLGRSHGAKRGPIVCALDSRFAAAVYFSGGISPDAMEPERDTVNFAPRATQPALMINGVDDHTFPLESSQKPLFELLGASTDQKQHILLGVGHTVEASLVIEQVDHWLARHFDDVNRTHSSWRDLAASHRNRADLALNAGQFEIAVNNYRHLLGLLVQHGGTDDDATISKIRFRLGLALEFQGGEKTKQATDIYRAASDERTRKLGPSHDSVHAARNRLGSLLSTTALALLGSSDMNEEIDLEQAKVDLREAESAVPKFAWPSLGLALAAYRQGSTEDAVNYLQQCESLQCSFGTEFYLRSIIAAEDGNYQEAQDWLTTIALEKTNRYRGQFKESVFLRAKAYQLVQRYSESIQSSKESGGALQRLSESYPNHYYLHWMQGRELIRKSKDMTAAHKRFRKAFEICPGYRSTDWYAITAQWLGDDDALAQCRDRLYGLSREKRGQNPGDQVQLARIYGRHPDADQYPANQISEFVDSVDTAIGYFGDKNASGTAKRLLQYRQGRETRIASFTRSGNPEEQAESMILSAITEYRFGDRRSAFERLDAARAFVRAKFPGPDGPTYKYVDSDHGWCVSNQLLQEAEALIELGSDDFDRQTAQAVGKLRSDLDERFGPSNSRAILLRVGNALVNHYSQQQPEIDTSETTED